MLDVFIELESDDLKPVYATSEASGADLKANILEPLMLKAGESALIPTGIKLQIPEGFEAQIRPRSGLALKKQITVLNSPATIDSDYRGELKIILINHSKNDFLIEPGMRIAQIVFCPVVRANFVEGEEFMQTVRGEGGFGHTGSH